jgi:hypothetical protein
LVPPAQIWDGQRVGREDLAADGSGSELGRRGGGGGDGGW